MFEYPTMEGEFTSTRVQFRTGALSGLKDPSQACLGSCFYGFYAKTHLGFVHSYLPPTYLEVILMV